MTPEATDAPIIFKEIKKSDRKMLRVWRTFYKGKELLSLQNFWRTGPEEAWDFGKAITFNYEDIDELIEGLQAMQKWYEDNT